MLTAGVALGRGWAARDRRRPGARRGRPWTDRRRGPAAGLRSVAELSWPGLHHRTDIATQTQWRYLVEHARSRSSWDRPVTRTRCSRRRTPSRVRHRGRRAGDVGAPQPRGRWPRSRRRRRDEGYKAFICGAGMAAHLAGAVAAHTTLPVVGVPLSGGALNGVDALYSTVQMPQGMPVATVAIDGALNAALLVVQILAVDDPDLEAKLVADPRSAPRPDAQRLDSACGSSPGQQIRTQNRLVSLRSSGRGPTAAGSWPSRPAPRRRACRPAPARRPRPRRRPASDASARVTGRDGPEVNAGLAGPNPASPGVAGSGRASAWRRSFSKALISRRERTGAVLRALADAGGGHRAAVARGAVCGGTG